VKFLFLPEGEDPDTYVRKHGKEAFESLLSKGSVPLSKFLLEELAGKVDLGTAEGRARLVHEAKPLLRQMQANALRMQLLRELAEKCRFSPEEVTQLCDLGGAAAAARPAAAPARVPRKPVTPLAEELLRLLVLNPGLCHSLSVEHRALLDTPDMAPVVDLIEVARGSGATTSAVLFEATRESQYAGVYQDVAARSLTDAAADDETARTILADILLKLESQRVKNEYERLNAKAVRNEAEHQRMQELYRRLAELKGAASIGSRAGA